MACYSVDLSARSDNMHVIRSDMRWLVSLLISVPDEIQNIHARRLRYEMACFSVDFSARFDNKCKKIRVKLEIVSVWISVPD